MIGIAWRQTSKAALKEAGATPPRLDTQGLLDVQVRACRAVDLPFAPHVLATRQHACRPTDQGCSRAPQSTIATLRGLVESKTIATQVSCSCNVPLPCGCVAAVP